MEGVKLSRDRTSSVDEAFICMMKPLSDDKDSIR